MGKTLKESPVTSRSARAGLSIDVHWRGIDPDVHLGYRKGRHGGRWLVRWYVGDQKYRQTQLGTADDILTEGTLSFDAAVKLARMTVTEARRLVKAAAKGPAPTVRSAVEAYAAVRDARASAEAGRSVHSDSNGRMRRYVLTDEQLAGTELQALSEDALKEWRSKLNSPLKRATRQRLANDFKAALNAAYREHRKNLPADFAESVKQGLKLPDECLRTELVSRTNQILDDAQVQEIIKTAIALDADGDLATLIIVLAATGSRFSQVRRMLVGDVQASQSRLLVPTSRKGKGRTDGHTALRIGPDVLSALRPIIDGRAPAEPLLCRWRHVQVGPARWERDARGPWQSASEMTRRWRVICEHVGLAGIVPYALRHSSIVRGIRFGLPIRLVAALHDTSVVMIERHYARWITDGLEDMAAKAIVALLPVPKLIHAHAD